MGKLNLFKNVTIILYPSGRAEIADSINKKLIDSKVRGIKDYKCITTENNGFQIKGLGNIDFRNESVDCLMYKKEIDLNFKLFVPVDSLIELMKESTFINGACTEEIVFVGQRNILKLLHSNMELYGKAVRDTIERNQTKTTKRIPGHLYSTIESDRVYIGEYYELLNTYSNYDNYSGNSVNTVDFINKDKSSKAYIIEIDRNELERMSITKLSQIVTHDIDTIKNNAMQKINTRTWPISYRLFKGTLYANGIKQKPKKNIPKVDNGAYIEIDIPVEQAIQKIIDTSISMVIKLIGLGKAKNLDANIIRRTQPFGIEDLAESEKTILKVAKNLNN